MTDSNTLLLYHSHSFRFQATRRRLAIRLHAAGSAGHLPLRFTEPAALIFGQVNFLQLEGPLGVHAVLYMLVPFKAIFTCGDMRIV